MSESKLWTGINNGYRGAWDAERVENRIAPGFPDVSYGLNGVNGFIELKYLAQWPKDGMINYVRHFGDQFPAQRRWIIRRGMAAGHCFLLLWVEKSSEWLLFDHTALALLGVEQTTVAALQARATLHFRDWIHWPALTGVLAR